MPVINLSGTWTQASDGSTALLITPQKGSFSTAAGVFFIGAAAPDADEPGVYLGQGANLPATTEAVWLKGSGSVYVMPYTLA